MTTNTAIASPRLHTDSSVVLIIDDNISGAQTLQMLLSLEGYKVLVAHTGAEGIELYMKHHPVIVLLDIDLPDTDGYSVAKYLRAGALDHHLSIIAMTGWGERQDTMRSIASGFDYHLTKPVNFDDLSTVLNNVLIESR